MIDCLINYCFTSRPRIYHLYGDVAITMNGCKIMAYARRSGRLSKEGSLSCHTCCDMGPRFFRSHPKNRTILTFASYDKQGDVKDLFLPGSSRVEFTMKFFSQCCTCTISDVFKAISSIVCVSYHLHVFN